MIWDDIVTHFRSEHGLDLTFDQVDRVAELVDQCREKARAHLPKLRCPRCNFVINNASPNYQVKPFNRPVCRKCWLEMHPREAV